MTNILGLHHVTAIASDPQRNVDFYVGFLGLRLVKRTVNFDDPQTYHLYYGDEQGNPGSIMTFFPWPGARRGRQGTGQAAVTSFAVTPTSIAFWVERLMQHAIKYEGPTKRGDETVLSFQDPDGLLLEIVGHAGAAGRPSWTHAHGISAEHAIHGFHAVTLWVKEHAPSERALVDVLGFRFVSESESTRRYVVGDGGPGTIIDVRAVGGFVEGSSGAGTVHHIAWAVADDEAELAVRERVVAGGLHPTPVIDRNYFHSVYFREPGGVLYELATNPPGFAVDEPADKLGEALKLPPQYESHRNEIQAVLPPIHLPMPVSEATLLANANGPEEVSGDALGFVHRYIPPTNDAELAAGTTLLLLHGTGGDENDLIQLGRSILPGAGLLSPRGKVLENGMPRFFRRLAEGVFDQEDLAKRTEELAQFIDGASATYGVDRDGVIAVGFSNGANIAASLLLKRGAAVRGAVLLSPMTPFEPTTLPNLKGAGVFIGAGKTDPIVPQATVERLAELLRSAGADVTMHWTNAGHTITKDELSAAHRWVEQLRVGA
jgi:predicted esterase/catechol 2,3-dioxygenase-like lactoylglutathione lyase family enzyme